MHISFDLGSNPSPPSPPLRIAVAGEFAVNPEVAHPLTVDKDSFKEVISRHAGELLFEVSNHLASHPEQLRIRLRITDLTTFSPAGLAAQVPELRQAVEFRDRLTALAGGALSYNEFEAGLDSYRGLDAFAEVLRVCQQARQVQTSKPDTGPLPSSTTGKAQTDTAEVDAIDRIMDMVAEKKEDSDATAAMTRLEQAISEIGSDNKRTVTPSNYSGAVALAERILTRQVNAILHHPLFQKYEALWRGLKFLIDRTDFREDIHISLLAIGRSQFGEDIREQILAHEMAGLTDVPLSLVVIPFAIENHTSDLEQLQLLGETTSELQIPALISASPVFFQLGAGTEADAMPYPGGLLSRPEYAKWNSLRNKDASRWLAMSFNRFLLRTPYLSSQRDTLGLAESIHCHNDHLWGESVWLLASLITASFARSGWPTEITGIDNGQVADLPVYSVSKPDTQEMQIPLEAMLPGQLAEDLAGSGFAPLTCKPNHDSAYVLWAPMLHRPEVYDDEAATAASRAMNHLPYQLLASRISEAVSSNIPRLRSASLSTNDLGTAIGNLVQQLLANTGAGASVIVEVQKEADKSGKREVDLRIHTGKQLVNGANVQLGFLI